MGHRKQKGPNSELSWKAERRAGFRKSKSDHRRAEPWADRSRRGMEKDLGSCEDLVLQTWCFPGLRDKLQTPP